MRQHGPLVDTSGVSSTVTNTGRNIPPSDLAYLTGPAPECACSARELDLRSICTDIASTCGMLSTIVPKEVAVNIAVEDVTCAWSINNRHLSGLHLSVQFHEQRVTSNDVMTKQGSIENAFKCMFTSKQTRLSWASISLLGARHHATATLCLVPEVTMFSAFIVRTHVIVARAS